MLARSHQSKFHLVLDVFDVDGATRRHTTLKGADNLLSQFRNGLVDPRTCCRCTAFNGEKRFGDGDRDFAVLEGHHGSVAFNNTHLAWSRCRNSGLAGSSCYRRGCGRLIAYGFAACLHAVVTSRVFLWLNNRSKRGVCSTNFHHILGSLSIAPPR